MSRISRLIIGESYTLALTDIEISRGGKALKNAFGALVDQIPYLLFPPNPF